jgi:hypothetical protein
MKSMLKTNIFRLGICRYFITAIVTLVYSNPSHSLDIESLVEYSDRGEKIDYVLTNNKDEDLFISTKIFEIHVDKTGEKVEKEYSSENFDDWDLTLSEAKFILRPGEVRTVTAYRIHPDRELASDKVFKVRFSPTSVNTIQNTVAINYGYGILSIFETSNEPQGYPEVSKVKDKIEISNKSNKFLEAKICSSKDDCGGVDYILPGRKTNISLPEEMDINNVYVEFSSNDGSFEYEAEL